MCEELPIFQIVIISFSYVVRYIMEIIIIKLPNTSYEILVIFKNILILSWHEIELIYYNNSLLENHWCVIFTFTYQGQSTLTFMAQ